VKPVPMPIPFARHRDLAEDEAITAVDEARDALGHGAEGDEPAIPTAMPMTVKA